jgi:hypothetical protein
MSITIAVYADRIELLWQLIDAKLRDVGKVAVKPDATQSGDTDGCNIEVGSNWRRSL